jgi:hypothetical protein
MQLCIAMTPPFFQANKPDSVLKIDSTGRQLSYTCRDYNKLIAALGVACLTYEYQCALIFKVNMTRLYSPWLYDLKIAYNEFLLRRSQGKLPQELKGLRTKNVEEAFALADRVYQSLYNGSSPLESKYSVTLSFPS